MALGSLRTIVDRDWAAEIDAAFTRIARPLRWPMADFRRRKVANASFIGYTFSRAKRAGVAGFAFGFAMRPDTLSGIREPPEAVAYAFVRPVGSALYEGLVTRRGSPTRKLVEATKDMGYPFEFRHGQEVVALRHRSLARVPPELFVLAASDFFMNAQQPLRGGGFVESVKRATSRPGP